MIQIDVAIKPLSANRIWLGRHRKTAEYRQYCIDVPLLATNVMLEKVDLTKKLEVTYEFGLSSKNSDWDNPVKALQDIIARHLGFNDRLIYKAHVTKVDVPKGKEYAKVLITNLCT